MYNFALARISLKTVARIRPAARIKARLPIRRGSEPATERLKFRLALDALRVVLLPFTFQPTRRSPSLPPSLEWTGGSQ
jgi:hypothetical protein